MLKVRSSNVVCKLLRVLRPNLWRKKVDEQIISRLMNFVEDEYLDEDYAGSLDTRFQDVANQVRDNGFVIIPNVFSSETINVFRQEFDAIIAGEYDNNYDVDRHEGAVCVRVSPRLSLSEKEYPLTCAFFDSAILNTVAESFYGVNKEKFYYNSEMFVHETPQTNEPLSWRLHWDRAQTLKFWIYIDDVPLEAGPMRVCKGSGKENRQIRLRKLAQAKGLAGGVDNLADINDCEIVSLTAPAGSIIIHDTDASHGSSPVEAGFVRRIIRGHTRLKNKNY